MRIDMHDIRRAAERNGSHWFEPGTMRFFRSRLAQVGYVSKQDDTVAYFVSSEQYVNAYSGTRCPRLYTVRRANLTTGDVGTVGEFQGFASSSGANAAAKRYAEHGEPVAVPA